MKQLPDKKLDALDDLHDERLALVRELTRLNYNVAGDQLLPYGRHDIPRAGPIILSKKPGNFPTFSTQAAYWDEEAKKHVAEAKRKSEEEKIKAVDRFLLEEQLKELKSK